LKMVYVSSTETRYEVLNIRLAYSVLEEPENYLNIKYA
jgi:hypothetical protein